MRRGVDKALIFLISGFISLAFGCRENVEVTTPITRDCRLKVALELEGLPETIGVVGDFNEFDPSAHPMHVDQDGVWRAAIDLPPGRAMYGIEVDGRFLLDPDNHLTARKDNQELSVFYADNCAEPTFAFVKKERHENADRYHLQMLRAAPDAGLDPTTIQATMGQWALAFEQLEDQVVVHTKGIAPGKYTLEVRGSDIHGNPIKPFHAPIWIEEEPLSLEDHTIYQVVLDRFASSNELMSWNTPGAPGIRNGGDLDGLMAVLESGYFEQFGITMLWISPLNTNPSGEWIGVEGGPPRYQGYHGYWPTSPRSIEPTFGDPETFRALVKLAHEKGIRVIMDVVLNHVHQEHPYYAENPGWFSASGCICGQPNCPWSAAIEQCWFTPYLPDLNWSDPDQVDLMVADALWWMDTYDLDGLRVDAVPMMPRFVTRHLTYRMHQSFEQLRTRHYLLGETFTGPEGHNTIRYYLGGFGLDGQFDFPLMWALRRAFAWEDTPLWDLADTWRASMEAWKGSGAVMANMVGNHDVTRFISEASDSNVAGRDPWADPPASPNDFLPYSKLLLAQSFVLTVPGAPVLYYGDEFGLAGGRDPDNRRPMRFGAALKDQELRTLETLGRIARARRCTPALRRGNLVFLREEAERLAFIRDEGDGAPAVVILQRRPKASSFHLKLPTKVQMNDTQWVDIVSGQSVSIGRDNTFTLPGNDHGAAVLLPSNHSCARIAMGNP